MVIHMQHPQHGEMDVYAEGEAVANEKNGWVRATVLEATPELPPDEQIPQEAFRRGPGRPRKEV